MKELMFDSVGQEVVADLVVVERLVGGGMSAVHARLGALRRRTHWVFVVGI